MSEIKLYIDYLRKWGIVSGDAVAAIKVPNMSEEVLAKLEKNYNKVIRKCIEETTEKLLALNTTSSVSAQPLSYWNKQGRKVKPGSKAIGRNFEGQALFDYSQTEHSARAEYMASVDWADLEERTEGFCMELRGKSGGLDRPYRETSHTDSTGYTYEPIPNERDFRSDSGPHTDTVEWDSSHDD